MLQTSIGQLYNAQRASLLQASRTRPGSGSAAKPRRALPEVRVSTSIWSFIPSWYVNPTLQIARSTLILSCERQARRYDSKLGGLLVEKGIKLNIAFQVVQPSFRQKVRFLVSINLFDSDPSYLRQAGYIKVSNPGYLANAITLT